MQPILKKTIKYVITGIVSIFLLLIVVIELGLNFVITPEVITPKIILAVNQSLDAKFDADRIELSFFNP